MIEKNQVHIYLLYDFKRRKTGAELYHTLVTVFGGGVIIKHYCQNWFKCFQNGEMSLKDYKHEKHPKIVGNKALQTSIDLGPCQTTREIVKQFGCTYSTIENYTCNREGKTLWEMGTTSAQ